MKFSEKLQKLRKENNLSQEGLADKLDVSRQSVSKWESGQTYPEMDKLLTMCKLFNITLDDLTNDEINFSEVKPKNKNTFDNLVDDVMYITDKSFSMFSNMNSKERGKCISELIILFVVLLFFKLPFEYIMNLGNKVIYVLPTGSYLLSSLWSFIINIVYLILFIFTFLYIYKTYFLDKYKEKDTDKENEDKQLSEAKVEENNNIIKEEVKKEVKEKKYHIHSFGSTLYEILGSIISFCFKGFLVLTSIPFIISFIALFIALIMLIILLLKGVIYFGFILCGIAAIILNWFLLKLIATFIFSYKPKFKFMFATFIIGLSLMGTGIGLSVYEIASTDIIYETPKTTFEYVTKTFEYDPNLNIVIDYYYRHAKYVEDETKNDTIEVQISYYKDLNYIEDYETNINGYTNIEYWIEERHQKKVIDLIINNLKEKKIYDYSKLYNPEIIIISSKSNIEKLKKNTIEFHKENTQLKYNYELEKYENEINDLTENVNNLLKEITNLNEEITTLKTENKYLKDKIQTYKDNLNSIIDE